MTLHTELHQDTGADAEADTAARYRRLRSLFAPRGIAVVGASDRSRWSRYTVENLRRSGYRGDMHLVNRRGGEVHGTPALTSLSEVPEGVDLAYALTGPDSLPSVIEQAHERGIANLAVIAAGFGETGEEGTAYERRLVAMAEERGMIILGPNNLGFLNRVDGVTPWSQSMPWPATEGGVGVMSQSGALGIYLMAYAEQRDVGLSHLVTLGNEAMLTVAEGVDYLVDEPGTRVIALYLESVRRPDAFVAAVDRALAAGKPVVVYKAGRGETGARVAAAHTGALTGDDAVFDAVFRQYGVIRVGSIEDLVTTAGLLDAYGVLPGNRVGFVTGSGAMCGVISDAADEVGLEVPEFAPETVTALRDGGLPSFATPQNPLDTTGYVVVEPHILPMAQRVVSQDPNIDLLVVTSWMPQDEEAAKRMDTSLTALGELARSSPVPVVSMEFLPTDFTPFARGQRRDRGLPHVVDSLSRGVRALGRATWWSERYRARLDHVPDRSTLVPALGEAPRRDAWSEQAAVSLLRDNGVPVVPGALVQDAAQARRAAEEFGGPVALKIASADLAHKSDVGGVALNLTPAEVGPALDAMRETVGRKAPDATLDGALVSPMRSGGTELLVGVVRDPVWGLVLAVGLGGVWVEVMRDVVLRRLPVSEADVLEAIGELRCMPLLTGARGAAPVDLPALAAVIARIGRLAVALGDDLLELEVNPLHVQCERIEALDALIRWA